jgi:TRAP-type C4-dicarboxylate transport system permease large subunit
MQMLQNKTIGMLAGGVAGFAGAEKFANDLALITMFYAEMALPPEDVFQAVWDTLSTSYYVLLIAGAAALFRWLTKNAPELLRSTPTPAENPAPTKE